MKYVIMAAAFALAVSFGVPAQAAPVNLGALTSHANTGDAVQKVWHHRRWHHRRWHHRRWHHRRWYHRRRGSWWR